MYSIRKLLADCHRANKIKITVLAYIILYNERVQFFLLIKLKLSYSMLFKFTYIWSYSIFRSF